ncbi:sulfurtransferase-like selenium metabolism protein YedF [Desulfoplanes sp.]
MNVCTLGCQGLPCPQPVLKCKEAIENDPGVELVVLVDNDAAKENVIRFLGVKGHEVVSAEKDGAVWRIAARPSGGVVEAAGDQKADAPPPSPQQGSKTLVFIASPVVGTGDDVLGDRLMQNFVSVLPELGDDLWRIILLNGGVELAIEGSPALEKLQELEKKGVSILVCGTCLDFFNLLEEKRVGETTNMLDVVTSMQLADKVLRV